MRDLDLQLLAGTFTLAENLLVLRHVLLHVVKGCELEVERGHNVEFVLNIVVSFLQQQLEPGDVSLLEHHLSEARLHALLGRWGAPGNWRFSPCLGWSGRLLGGCALLRRNFRHALLLSNIYKIILLAVVIAN